MLNNGVTVYAAAKIPSHPTRLQSLTLLPLHVTKDIYKRTSHREQPQISENSLILQATDQDSSHDILTTQVPHAVPDQLFCCTQDPSQPDGAAGP